MKPILLLAMLASTAFAQDPSLAAPGAEYLLRVRAADTTKQAEMRIEIVGGVFGSLGASKAANGSVRLGPGGGTGSGTVFGSLMPREGRITFSTGPLGDDLELVVSTLSNSATPRLIARGRTVSVVYTQGRGLSVEAHR